MIGVFARRDHPKGYGYASGTAHGYVVILVRCADLRELRAVAAKLSLEGLPEPFGHPYPWYGGPMDCVAAVADAGDVTLGTILAAVRDDRRRLTLGDNRYVGTYGADEILEVGEAARG